MLATKCLPQHNNVLLTSLSVFLLVFLSACSGGDDSEPNETPATTSVTEKANTTTPEGEAIDRPEPTGPVPTEVPPPPSSFDRDGDGVLNWQELEEGVNANIGTFTFPDNYETSATILLEREAGSLPSGIEREDVTYDLGTEVSLPGEAYFCAWAYSWFDARGAGNSTLKDESMDHMRNAVTTVPSFVIIEPELTDWLNSAELGDSAALQHFTDQLCVKNIFMQQTSAFPSFNKI